MCRKLLLIPIFSLMFVCSCRKIVEDKKKDFILSFIASGDWHIEEFREGASTITDQFTGFNFHFTKEGTVTAKKDNITENGTWVGDATNYTITANFPTSPDPIKKLNQTWKLTDSSEETVIAETSGPDTKNTLRLRKN
ncbi:MAG: hypothetical protein ABI415_04875 [Flavitalea sp.]